MSKHMDNCRCKGCFAAVTERAEAAEAKVEGLERLRDEQSERILRTEDRHSKATRRFVKAEALNAKYRTALEDIRFLLSVHIHHNSEDDNKDCHNCPFVIKHGRDCSGDEVEQGIADFVQQPIAVAALTDQDGCKTCEEQNLCASCDIKGRCCRAGDTTTVCTGYRNDCKGTGKEKK